MSDTKKLLVDPLSTNNPITVQVLGVCSALAVTSTIANSLVMGVAVIFVTALANLTISLLRNLIPGRIRMIVQLVVIAFLVTLVSIFLKAFLYDLSKELSVFVGLIITNCIVMGRLEAFAMGNKPIPALLDGVGNGMGYAIILIIVGAIRELFGAGQLMGFQVIPEAVYNFGYENNGLMVLPISSIFLIGIIIWIQRSRDKELVDIS
mgnify:CR=1 FL=1